MLKLWTLTLTLFFVIQLKAQPRHRLKSCNVETDLKCETNKTKALEYLDELNRTMVKFSYITGVLSFNYNTNLTDYNAEVYRNKSLEVAKLEQKMSRKLQDFSWDAFNDEELRKLAEGYFITEVPESIRKTVRSNKSQPVEYQPSQVTMGTNLGGFFLIELRDALFFAL